MSEKKRIALLIDCENSRHQLLNGVINELSKLGRIDVRHAHADWSQPSNSNWKDSLNSHAVRQIQTPVYVAGKNTVDGAIIIDAMDLLHLNSIDIFALMSSDSDFTALAVRLKESGKVVYGFGEKKTLPSFVEACSHFIYIENNDDNIELPSSKSDINVRVNNNVERMESAIHSLKSATLNCLEEDGWANLSKVSMCLKSDALFSLEGSGYKKLSNFVRATQKFEVVLREKSRMYIRLL